MVRKKVEENFVDSIFDMALIFSENGRVYLRDDEKEIQDIVVGDELLGWRGEYRKVVCVYKPKYFIPPMIRFGIGVGIEDFSKRDRAVYIEVGEQTKVAVRNLVPSYDLVPMPKKSRDVSLYTDAVEVCSSCEPNPTYKPGAVLKLTQRRSLSGPYLIGIEGSCLVVNDIVVLGCDADKVKLFIKKEEEYNAERIKEKIGKHVEPINGLREDPEFEESDFGEGDGTDD